MYLFKEPMPKHFFGQACFNIKDVNHVLAYENHKVKPKKFKEGQKEAPHCFLDKKKSLMDSFFYLVFLKRLNYAFNTILHLTYA